MIQLLALFQQDIHISGKTGKLFVLASLPDSSSVRCSPGAMLSSRAAVYLGEPEFLMKCFGRCSEDPYSESSNKAGYVNLGTAVNALCEKELNRRLNQGDLWRHTPVWQHYFGTV